MFNTKFWHLIALMRNERRSLDELLDRQLSKLQILVNDAYRHVSFYREKYKQAGFQPGDLKSLDDLKRLPIISKADFHQGPSTAFIDRRIKTPKALIPIKTSGSSGQTLEFYIDHAYDQFRKAQFLRPYLTNGQKLTDRVLTFKGRPRRAAKVFERIALLREQQVASHLDPALHLETLRRVKPSVVRGYPSVLALVGAKLLFSEPLARYPRRIFTDSELLTPTLRRSIEAAFKRRVIDIYGSLETDNIAYECEGRCGYHIAIDTVILEFIHNDRPVQPGVSGEIVCTVLENHAMPFIRYRLNDFGIGSSRPCTCGRSFPMMTGLIGRTHEYAVTREGKPISSTVLLGTMDRFAGEVKAFQIIQEQIDCFNLRLIPGADYRQSIAHRIKTCFKELFPGARVDIVVQDKLQHEISGKVMPFISRVKVRKAASVQRRDEN